MSSPSAADDLYPQPCAFCAISQTYTADPSHPIPLNPDPDKLSPQCHLLLSTPHVLAFLDIMPMAPGHILVTTRKHYRTLGDLSSSTSASNKDKPQDHLATSSALGLWLPLLSAALCRVTGVEDWNVVQNNGARAAQVVPHVHFHLIPRYQEGRRRSAEKEEEGRMKSWRMFGRGTREDLDDEEGAEMAGRLREVLREVVEGSGVLEERGRL